MKMELVITDATLNGLSGLRVMIDGKPFWAGEKYTILELGWAVYMAGEELPEGWTEERGETRAADEERNELASSSSTLITTHPVLVALSLRSWWHGNGKPIATAPLVEIPSFEEAVEEVRTRDILNDFNKSYAGTVPGLERWAASVGTTRTGKSINPNADES